MFEINTNLDLEKNYQTMVKTVKHVIEGENDEVANLSNISSVLNCYLTEINWVGFYIFKENQLVLGPFQGKPACIRIPIGRGVCGACAKTKETQVVPDVHLFPGHIACDSASNSEIVIPVFKNGELYGVLDIDSPIKSRFGELEQKYLKEVVDLMGEEINNWI